MTHTRTGWVTNWFTMMWCDMNDITTICVCDMTYTRTGWVTNWVTIMWCDTNWVTMMWCDMTDIATTICVCGMTDILTLWGLNVVTMMRCDVTYSYVWRDIFIYAWYVRKCDMRKCDAPCMAFGCARHWMRHAWRINESCHTCHATFNESCELVTN